jgi:hypothetical protein
MIQMHGEPMRNESYGGLWRSYRNLKLCYIYINTQMQEQLDSFYFNLLFWNSNDIEKKKVCLILLGTTIMMLRLLLNVF